MSDSDASSTTQKDETDNKPLAGIDFLVPIESFLFETVTTAIGLPNEIDIYGAHERLHAAKLALKLGDPALSALEILSTIASYHFEPSNRLAPFQPMAVFKDKRTLIPGDLLLEQVEILIQFSAEIPSPALRARVSDVCCVRIPSNANAGFNAVEAYVKCVNMAYLGEAVFMHSETGPTCFAAHELLTRAVFLARRMGWIRPEFDPLREIIENVAQLACDTDDGWGFVRFGRLSLDNNLWERKKVAQAAERLSQSERIAKDFLVQRELWELAALAYHLNKEEKESNRCLVAAAETYISSANARVDSAMVQASFLNDAIQAYMRIPGTKEKRNELRDRLTAVQSSISDEMSPFSLETDITKIVKAVEAAVDRKSLSEMIRACFTCELSPNHETLRSEAIREDSTSILSFASRTVHDHQGRVYYNVPNADIKNEALLEDRTRYLMNQRDKTRRQLVAAGKIATIRRIIMFQHYISLEALMVIMTSSSFVPPGHEIIFAKGAFRFLNGDDLEAAHLVIPQLENSLRYLLSQNGVETNRINQDGTQEEAMLGSLLDEYRKPLLDIIPEDLLWEIDLLFNSRGGPSVRNELSHGKMRESDFWDTELSYSVWLVLKMAFIPTLQIWDEVAANIEQNSR
ncbi:protein of unknown function [Thalassospira xiamenensis M-5 = DSM 17429]|uniref:DUF4209 domain-containing protein n=1 Tax=Thalassospira xiamenensis M-5 = DSM 17429 TaxID=1123366 RepID=A0AB72UAZ8_9PROT|nr:DUF4209 domain-containing protein [Thalassospira xiamenensis]AJD51302.1 hypothetical protein TH3_05910 [Thalassospira xiamenensis M-5 = DSM 17429]SIT14745.1 protein of unknown function [Thalassospira xiamenensis M-5 = DSM 17429]